MRSDKNWKRWSGISMIFIISIFFTGCRESKEGEASVDGETSPEILEKLEVVAVESDMWLLLFKNVLGQRYQFDFLYKPFSGRTEKNRIPASQALAIGDTFFKEDPGKARFKLKSVEDRVGDEPEGQRPRKWAIIEDLSEQKKGRTYQIAFNLSTAEKPLSTQYNHTVVFNVIGEEGSQFKVEENGSFSLPSGGEEKSCKLLEVKLEDPGPAIRKAVAVIVQYEEDGEMMTREIPVPQTP